MAKTGFDNRDNVEQGIVDLAHKNPEFRKELLADPRAALAKIFGGDLPDNVKVEVHEEDANTVHIILPTEKDSFANSDTTYCNQNNGKSWTSCGYELSCYGPTCCP
jgi:hypothetical protein